MSTSPPPPTGEPSERVPRSEPDKGAARRAARTEQALHAWRLQADLKREAWNEKQAQREAAARARRRKMRAVQLGLVTGAAGMSLFGFGVVVGLRVPSTPVPPPLGASLPIPPPLEVHLQGVTAPVSPPEPDPLVIPGTAQPWHAAGEFAYGARFHTSFDDVRFEFRGPDGIPWPDDDPLRICRTRSAEGDVYTCRYQRRLVQAIRSGDLPPGRWTVYACAESRCELVAEFPHVDVPTRTPPEFETLASVD